MVLDLKDAFFCLRLHPNSQPVFAFEWHNPENGRTGQLTWTRLPQGFKNSPTLFDEALHRDLAMMVVMEEAALVTLEEAEAMEVVDRVMETRAVAMAGVAAMTAITTEEAEAALAVVVVGIQ